MIGYGEAISRLAESNDRRRKENTQSSLQRRNQVTDIFGVEHKSQGDANHPATFYISVSPDLVYFERFQFKLLVQSFAMPIGNNGSTGLTTVGTKARDLNLADGKLFPNPHAHEGIAHNHSLSPGITLTTSSVSNFRVVIEGIDVTEQLKSQFDGQWVTEEGIYPKSSDSLANYDILKAAGELWNWQQGKILQPGYKKIEIYNDGPFNCTLVNYLKYSHVNR